MSSEHNQRKAPRNVEEARERARAIERGHHVPTCPRAWRAVVRNGLI